MFGRVVKIVGYPTLPEEEWTHGDYVEGGDRVVAVALGEGLLYETGDGRCLIQKDYRVDGEVWQVHLTDADPYPSCPHAHCVGGRSDGLKLHLGTRQLWDGRRPLDRFLRKKPFARLIYLIQPKFPGLRLPLPGE